MLSLSSVSLLASAASGYTPTGDFYKISETEHKIAPGIAENRVIVNKTSGNQQEMVYAVTVDPAAKATTSIMTGYKDYDGSKWGMQTVRLQADKAAKKTGANIVAAYNADIFNMQTGEPRGVVVMGGQVYKSGLGYPYFGITKSGDYVMGEHLTADVLATLQEAVSGFYMIVENGQRVGPALNPDSNEAPKTAVGLKADGTLVCVTVDGRNYPISSSLDDYDLATIMMDLGCMNVLNLDGGGSTTYLAKYEGKDVLELANRPSDAVERAVATSLFIVSTAKPSGVFDHASLTPNNTLYTPNSTVQFSAIGVDSAGEPADLPADGAFALADDSFGIITPDGVFTSTGKTGIVDVNYVSGGAVVGSTFIEITTPDELYLPSEEYSLDFDEVTNFELVAKNAGRTVILKDGDLNFSAEVTYSAPAGEGQPAGEFIGLTFKARSANSVEANVTITSAFDSAVTATTKVVVGAEPVMLYDFEYTAITGARKHLSEAKSNANLYVLMFSDNSSGSSIERMRLSTDIAFGKAVESGQIEVINIIVGDVPKKWDADSQSYSSTWLVGASKDVADKIDLRIMPCIYVLDQNFKVIAKNRTVDFVKSLFSK